MNKLISFKFRKRQSNSMIENCEILKLKYTNLVVEHKSMLAFYTQKYAFAIYFG